MKCDCTIGIIEDERVTKKSVIEAAQSIVDFQNNERNIFLFQNKNPVKSTADVVDGRKGYLSRFNYCLYCGTKINSKEIIGNINQYSKHF